MNKESVRRETLYNYDLYIFDLDGTLYYQKPFRYSMLLFLVKYLFKHPLALGDLFLIKLYRNIRENWEEREKDSIGITLSEDSSLEEKQYAYVAKMKNTSIERVKNVVQYFMIEAPLSLLPKYVDADLVVWINKLREMGKTVIVYSDYPVEDKLRALKIDVDGKYCASDEKIGVMKPNPKGIEYILSEWRVDAENALVIGDRYEKDGLAAVGNNVDYLILSSKKKQRRQYLFA